MSTVCANCGEVFEEAGKLVCPHCGADVDLTHAEPPHEMSFDDPRMDDADYASFLESEGLVERKGKRAGCAAALVLLAVLAGSFHLLL